LARSPSPRRRHGPRRAVGLFRGSARGAYWNTRGATATWPSAVVAAVTVCCGGPTWRPR